MKHLPVAVGLCVAAASLPAQTYLALPATANAAAELNSYEPRGMPFMAANSRVQMFYDSTEVGNQGYVADESPWVVGVGASAISSLPDGYAQNAAAADRYIAALEAGGLATARGTALSDADRLRGEIIERLMCLQAVDLSEICRRHRVEPASFLADIDALPKLIEDGLISREADTLCITARGRPLVRSVCAAFDSHLRSDAGRHARAI